MTHFRCAHQSAHTPRYLPPSLRFAVSAAFSRLSIRHQGSLTCPIWCWQVTWAMTKISQWVTTMASKTPGSTVSLVGPGSFLDKPSRHMVGYLGKDSHNINTPHDEWCPVCKTKGQTQALKTYRINITQSIFLCSNPQCIYPLGYTPLDNIIANTADLKKSSSKKHKKRNSSEFLPTPLLGEKRPKIDLTTRDGDSFAVQDNLCNTLLDFPTLEWETSSPTRLQHDLKEGTEPRAQNGSGTSPALWDKSGLSVLPTGSFSRREPNQPHMFPAVQNGHREVLTDRNLEAIDPVNDSSSLPLSPETDLMINKMDNAEEKLMTEPLNEEHKLNDPTVNSASLSSCVSTPQNGQQECQIKEDSFKEVLIPPCSNILLDLESELPPAFNEQPKEHLEKMDDLTDKGDVEDVVSLLPKDTHVDISRNAVFSNLLHEESDQQMSSLLDMSPPACPEDAVLDRSFGIADLSESLQLMQACGKKTEDQSDGLQKCPGEAQHLRRSSTSLLLEDGEKDHSTFKSCELEKHQPESLSKDKSDTTSLEPDGSTVSIEDQPAPIPNLSLLDELVQKCQISYSEENNLPKVMPENEVKNACADHPTPVPSVEDKVCADAAVISSPGNQLSKTLDTSQPCQTSDMASPTVSLPDHEPVCHPDDGSLEKVCEADGTSASMSDAYDTHTDVKSQNDMSLLKPQVLLQDCMKCHCSMNVPFQSLHKDTYDNPPPSPLSIEVDHSYAKHPMTEVQVLLRDYLKCHCGNTQTPGKDAVCSSLCERRMDSDHAKVSAQSYGHEDCTADATVENTAAAASPNDCESPASKKKKKISGNAVLPDLLLDIQSERRNEEPIFDATLSDTWRDGKVKAHNNALEILNNIIQDGRKASDTLETSLNSDEATADDSDDEMEAESVSPAQGDEVPTSKKLKAEQKILQWKNKHNLCWLDCILSALLHSETLNNFVNGDHHMSKESLIPDLFTRYNQATEMFLKTLALKKRTSDHKRPKYEKCMQELRISIFEKLQPLLKCKLGKKESPVFAFPLLLGLDPQTENLFMYSFVWQFKCEVCNYSYEQRCQTSLTTFTRVIPEWLPLNAVHLGPCNRCRHPKQKRAMVLEKLNSLFMVHFVDGAPTNDLNKYSFQFQGHLYEVKAIIKYKNTHFSSWILNNDGSWLESDGLRGSFCRRYRKIRIRADDIHIVIWERNGGKSFEENIQFGAVAQASEFNSANASMVAEDASFSSVGTAELSQQVAPVVPLDDLNTSDPLAGMEGYADDDVITLTLVPIPTDVNGCPIETSAKLQVADTCMSNNHPDLGEESAAVPEMSTNVQSKGLQGTSLVPPISSDSNVQTAPIMNCGVALNPLIQSPLNPAGEAIATSKPSQQPYNPKKSIGGNWMNRLMKKNNYLFAENGKMQAFKALPPLKVTDSSDAQKKAQNFNGFLSRSMSKTSNILPANTASKPSFNGLTDRGASVAKPLPTPSGFKTRGSNGLDYSKMLKEGSSSSEDKIRRLRLKLLKKLKAKKNELATLEKLAQKQECGPTGAQANGAPHGGFNRKERLRGFLQELQEHIDNVDDESVGTMSSCTSICSSPGDAEFFSELFSPAPTDNQPNDSRYLEMLADGCGISGDGHLHKGSGGVPQSVSGNNSDPTISNLDTSDVDKSVDPMTKFIAPFVPEDSDYFDFDDYF